MITVVLKRSLLFSCVLCVSAAQLLAIQLSERDQHLAAEHFRAGMEALLSERYEPAEREFKETVKLDPLHDAAFYGLGQVYMKTQRYDAAVKAYIASRDAFKSATAADALTGAASDRRIKDQIEALKDNERNLSRLSSGTNPNAQKQIEQIQMQIQELESRRSRRSGTAPPKLPAGLSMALGSAYFRLNDLANAEHEYQAAVDTNPNFGEAHSNLAVVYLITGRTAEAEAEVKAAEKAGFRVNPKLKEDIAAKKKH
jgi:tetratricopeptide (TPR) repeat protein